MTNPNPENNQGMPEHLIFWDRVRDCDLVGIMIFWALKIIGISIGIMPQDFPVSRSGGSPA